MNPTDHTLDLKVRDCIQRVKALRKAIRQVFGNDVPVQRCVQHKLRNVVEHLPERDREPVKLRRRRAWKETDHDRALEQLNTLAVELDHAHPGAAASLREGMEETLTVTRLGITGTLKLTLQSTNPCESMISTVRVIHRNVKNWSSADTCLRWTAAGMLEAESRFRKVQGYRGLANLAVAIEHDLLRRRQQTGCATIEEEAAALDVTIQPGTAVTVNFHDERGNLLPRRQTGSLARALVSGRTRHGPDAGPRGMARVGRGAAPC